MDVLIGCECSATVRDSFRRRGHNAWSCDIKEGVGEFHIRGDIFDAIECRKWDLLIVHPPCTFLCSSGLHWNGRVEGREEETKQALAFVRRLFATDIDRMALENPVGKIGTEIRPADQYIQPYEFGEDASKNTGLWLKNLPLLRPTSYYPPRVVEYPPGSGRMVNRWGNQTDSGQNKLPPSTDRGAIRSVTYLGIAEAMAEQWGGNLPPIDRTLFNYRDDLIEHDSNGKA